MGVPGVRPFPLEKRNDVPQRLKIFQDLPTPVAVENYQRYSPETLARNAPVRPVHNHVVDALFSPPRNPFHFLDFRERRAAQSRRLWCRNIRRAVIQLYEALLRSAKDHL